MVEQQYLKKTRDETRSGGLPRRQDVELRQLRQRYDDLCASLLQGPAGDLVRETEIVQDLQRLSDRIVALEMQDGPMSDPGDTPSTESEHNPPEAVEEIARNFDRMIEMIERQTIQVEHVLRRCNENRDQLERVERRLIETTPLLERQLPELRDAVDRQRQRVTALTVAVQRLSQWLVSHRNDRP